MKTKDELNALKEEVETLNKKLAELTEEELSVVTGGFDLPGFGGSVIEVGKWYRNPAEMKQYEFTLFPSETFYYCAEKLGERRFRFEQYVIKTLSDRVEILPMGDTIQSGLGFVESPALPIPDHS